MRYLLKILIAALFVVKNCCNLAIEWGFPGSSAGKESACNAGNPGSIPGLGRFLGRGHVNPLQYSSLENPHGQRSLAGYSLWVHKELDMTELHHSTVVECSKNRYYMTICSNRKMYISKKKQNSYL